MNIKYRVTLTSDERERLRKIVSKGKTEGYRIRHAQILLKLDEIPENVYWTYDRIGASYSAARGTK